MFTFAEFQILGHVGKITPLTKCLKISVAASERWTDRDTGEVKEKTRWNTVTLWERARGFDWLKANLKVSDIVHVRGSIEETSYQKEGGETVYATDLRVDSISIIPRGTRPE